MLKKREFILSGAFGYLKLPVNPASYHATSDHNVQRFETLEVGELSVAGERKLKTLSFDSFFPNSYAPYCTYKDFPTPLECVSILETVKHQKQALRVLITNSPINTSYYIESFKHHKKSGSDDIYYEISLIEVRALNVPMFWYTALIDLITSLRVRP